MSDFEELDDILLFLKERKENIEDNGDSFDEKPVKSRSQRAKEEQERLEKERKERERLEQERLEKERKERERLERERLEKEFDAQIKKSEINVIEEKKDTTLPPSDCLDFDDGIQNVDSKSELIWLTSDGKVNKLKKDRKSLTDVIKSFPKNLKKFPEIVKTNFKNKFLPRLKRSIKSDFTKQTAIFAALIIAISGIIVGGDKLYEYSRVAYLKPYQQKYPDVEFPQGILEEMCDDYGKNNTVVGNIKFEDANLNTSVTCFQREGYCYAPYSKNIDCDKQFTYVDLNGCGDFEKYYSTAENYVNSNQTITYTSLYKKRNYQIIAAFYTNTDPQDDNGYVFPYGVYGDLTEKSFENYSDKINSRTLYNTGHKFEYENKYITVSMNSDFMPNFKFVVVGVCVDEKNSEKITEVSENSRIHYPQSWYDLYGVENPYRFAAKWYPEIYSDSSHSQTNELSSNDFDLLK